MKEHTSQFKEELTKMGKEIDSIITYDNVTLHDELYAVTPHYEGNILKSVMKQLDVESSVDIPLDTVINYQLGIKVGNSFEYLNYGNYVVYKSEKKEDTDTYLLTCYDKMLYTMKNNEDLGVVYPISIEDYFNALASKVGLEVEEGNFKNKDLEIQKELYLGLEYTYRDILDEIAEATGSIIVINLSDKIEVKYLNTTNDTIDENYLKDINVKFGEKYGPINSVVLSRSAESDNVYLRDEQSVTQNGLCEIKIKDNQIMNWNDRSDYLQGILEAVDGIEYYINDFTSPGLLYYEVGDYYNVTVDQTIYKCLMLNDEINVTLGINEIIHTNMPEESETDYNKADKTDRRINQTYLIVDKQGQTISSLVETTTVLDENITNGLDNANGEISNLKTIATRLEQNAKEFNFFIDDYEQNGAKKIRTTMGYTFDNEGLKINKDNAETGTIIDEASIRTIDKTGVTNTDLFYAGYVKQDNEDYPDYRGQTIVYSKNMIVQQYLVVPNSRFEAYENPVLGGQGTGAFGI